MSTLCIAALMATCILSCESHETTMAPSNDPQKGLANAKESSGKITICHRTGNGSSHSITVSTNAWPAHERHGDALGDCDSSPTPN